VLLPEIEGGPHVYAVQAALASRTLDCFWRIIVYSTNVDFEQTKSGKDKLMQLLPAAETVFWC
jgi:hypothetical protein